jgi:DNA-directed RNA polymerase specialized sigma24 family protein
MTDRYYLYTPEQIKDIIVQEYYHNTTIWSAICRIANITCATDSYTDQQKIDKAISTILSSPNKLEQITNDVNTRQVISALHSYYNLEQSAVDTYLDLTDALNQLNGRDRQILLAYYVHGYQIDEIVALFYKSLTPEQVKSIIAKSLERMVKIIRGDS